MTDKDAWTLYNAQALAMLMHPGNRNQLDDIEAILDTATEITERAMHRRRRALQLGQPTCQHSSQEAPQSSETSSAAKEHKAPTHNRKPS